MQRNKLTFNDLPEVVGELCERISSMENLLTEKLHQQHNEVKKDTHVPMTVDEVCEYLGISKSSFYYKAKQVLALFNDWNTSMFGFVIKG